MKGGKKANWRIAAQNVLVLTGMQLVFFTSTHMVLFSLVTKMHQCFSYYWTASSAQCPDCLLLPLPLSNRAWSEQEPGSRHRWDSWLKLTRDTPCHVTSCSEIKCLSVYFKREPLLGDWRDIGLTMVIEFFCIPCGGDSSPASLPIFPTYQTILILTHEFSCFLLSWYPPPLERGVKGCGAWVTQWGPSHLELTHNTKVRVTAKQE